jgi:hypothetical protein
MSAPAIGDQAIPDVPERRTPPAALRGPDGPPLPEVGNLDGTYLWLGPTGSASRIDGEWDSTIGAELALVHVREARPIAVLGAAFGAAKWTQRDGGRIWLDAVIGTRALGPSAGITVGSFLELGDLAHPRAGASIGVWMFAGVTPYVRVGAVSELGAFVDLGLHIALPAWRWR